MTSHELARKLLELPDLVVICEDGMDPNDTVEVSQVIETIDRYYDNDCHTHEGPVIRIN